MKRKPFLVLLALITASVLSANTIFLPLVVRQEAAHTNTPTPEPTSTNTPGPTPTATEIVAPDPIVYTGTGSQLIDVDIAAMGGKAVVHIIGNAGSTGFQFFTVKSVDASNRVVDYLVSTLDPYEGWRPIGFVKYHKEVVRLQVEGVGDWTITLMPLYHAPKMSIPSVMAGNSDGVYILQGGTPDLAHITGNEDSHLFSVKAYTPDGFYDSLVSTIDPYDGTTTVPQDAWAIGIQASSPWQIDITAK